MSDDHNQETAFLPGQPPTAGLAGTGSTAQNGATDSSGAPTNIDATADSGLPGREGAPTGGGLAATKAPSSSSVKPGVRLIGRMDIQDKLGPRFAWSGSGIVAQFSGTSLGIRLNDTGQNQFTVLIDGEVMPTLVTLPGPNEYALANELPIGQHEVEVYRRTEASFGPTQFLGFALGADGALLPPPQVARRIEVIGDSVSAGYGNEGTQPCAFSAETENHYLTYGAIAARTLGAELTTIAWSGKGVVYNYDADLNEPMPALYGRTLPQDPSSTYDFGDVPDVVVINLGTNDFSTDDDPPTEVFAEGYARLLAQVRAAYPSTFILCTVGPLLSGEDLNAAREGIAGGVAAFEASGGVNVRVWDMDVPNGTPPGCDSHPNLATHQAMANALIPELQRHFE